ncbi:DUF4097 family beta strand repeat-containing protein [Dethiothermospora halolimnae]|uniref:DUF4097 family beta strand repeat-containing protein n=1 Tax=Dethiothermospora halolimnae TaxID=3114390 RepID=UPI003CCB97E7
MNKNINVKKIVLILTAIVGISFLLLGAYFLLAFNDVIDIGMETHNIDEEKIFDIENIDEIYIDTTSTDINVISTNESEVKAHFYGTVKGGYTSLIPKLVAEEKGSNINIDINRKNVINIGFGFVSGDVKLDVYIPEKYEEDLKINTTSGDIEISRIKVNNFYLDSTSGDISGIEMETVKSTIDTTSGEVDLEEYIGDLNLESISGDINIEYKKFNNDMKIETTSGNVELLLPKDSKFNFAIDTTSGEIETDIPVTLKGDIDDDHLEGQVGDSDNDINIDATSGDVEVNYN